MTDVSRKRGKLAKSALLAEMKKMKIEIATAEKSLAIAKRSLDKVAKASAASLGATQMVGKKAVME